MNKDIDELLQYVLDHDGSDLHLKVGRCPTVRIHGKLRNTEFSELAEDDLVRIVGKVIPDRLRKRLEDEREADLSYQPEGFTTRFRVNAFFQKGHHGMVFRQIPSDIPSIDSLGFDLVLKELVAAEQGIILVTGPTGSGKSTTLAAMIDEINSNFDKHIMTIEDPMELVQHDKRCLINQREVGMDTLSFTEALRRVLRQDPDVILIGEMRDAETINIATTAAETGHLVLSTLHTNDAKQSVDRIINTFPPEEHFQVRMKLAGVLNAVISQSLLPVAKGKGRVAVQEIMINTPTIRKCIETGEVGRIDKIIEESRTYYRMISKNQALFEKWHAGVVTEEVALAMSNNPNDLRLKMQTEQFSQDVRQRGDRRAPPPSPPSEG